MISKWLVFFVLVNYNNLELYLERTSLFSEKQKSKQDPQVSTRSSLISLPSRSNIRDVKEISHVIGLTYGRGRKLRTANTPGSLRCTKPPVCVSGKDTVVKVRDVWAQGGIVGGWITALWSRGNNGPGNGRSSIPLAFSYRTALREMNEWEAENRMNVWEYLVGFLHSALFLVSVLPPDTEISRWISLQGLTQVLESRCGLTGRV